MPLALDFADVDTHVQSMPSIAKERAQRLFRWKQEGVQGTLGNQVQLQQVILNLVMNAIESMSSLQTRLLHIKTELSQSSTVHVSVEDTGAGIKPSDVTRLFQPMFTTKVRGMGMGLSICKSIIENHDGRIWVSPGTNGGSIFQFELPTIANKDRSGSALSGEKQSLHGRHGMSGL